MVDIVTAILIGFCFAVVVGALTFTSYHKSNENSRIRIAEINHGIVKETKRSDFSNGFTPMWTTTRYTTSTSDANPVSQMKSATNSVEKITNRVCDLDPTTAFPKVEEAKSYKAEPNESVD